MFNQNLDRQVN